MTAGSRSNKIGLGVALIACLAVLPRAGQGQGTAGAPLREGFAVRPAPSSDLIRSDFYIPVQDGTRLAASLYLPARNGVAMTGKFPVIFNFTAARIPRQATHADRSGGGPISGKMPELARYGYAYIEVERRGMSASFGVRRGYHPRAEAQDSQYLLRWSASQPWSNGVAGIYGCSNTGDAAMHALTIAPVPDNLKGVFAGCFNWDKYDGGFAGMLFNWGTGPDTTADQDFAAATPVDGDDERQLLRQATDQHRASTSLLQLWKSMPYRDSVSPLVGSAFWKEGSVSNYADAVTNSGVPVFMLDGWNDDFRGQTLIALANLKQEKTLLIGPWGHCDSGDIDVFAEALQFFNHYLKGQDYRTPPAIRYFVQNAATGRQWRSATAWPIPQSRRQTMFLGAAAGAAANDHVVETRHPARSENVSFRVNTDLACPNAPLLGNSCAQDDKGVTFTSAVLRRDLQITGDPVVRLWASANQDDGRIFAYLEDVAADGTSTVITDGRIRAALRGTAKAPWDTLDMPWHQSNQADLRPLAKGKPVELTIGLLPAAYIVKAGHRWRLSITGADVREKLRPETAAATVWTIETGAGMASQILLPVVANVPG